MPSPPATHHHHYHHLLLLLAAARLLASADAAGCDEADEAALLAVKSAFGAPPALAGWAPAAAPCCAWPGVACDGATGRVAELTVFARNVSAAFPAAALANLTALRTLNLAYNRLRGRLPASLGAALRSLAFLRLDGNLLTGPIPATLAVPDLSLADNRLSGALPRAFAGADFRDLDLAGNLLGGDAAFLFGAAKNLSALRLSRNRFAFDLGAVELPHAMDILDVDHNEIYGRIPRAVGRRRWLQFDVSHNQLCGPIPRGRYMHRFGAESYAGNKCLCGPPLPPCKQ